MPRITFLTGDSRYTPRAPADVKVPRFLRAIEDLAHHPGPTMERVNAAIAIVTRSGRILICQRKSDDHLGGFWEFPGGKCEDGETLEQCIRRELLEEVNIDARPIAQLRPIDHTYPHAQVRLHPFLCQHEGGEPKLLECQAAKWIQPQELRQYQFPPANETLIEEVIEYFQRSGIGD